ncbi:MAG: hypothetical protein ACP6IP_08275 [Candidatus Njordarchaeia archaeon]
MENRQRNPFKWLLLSQLHKKIRRIKWIVLRNGRVNLTTWEDIFDLINDVDDFDKTCVILRDILEFSPKILNNEEQLFVEVEAVSLLSIEKDIVYPLYEKIRELADEVRLLRPINKALKMLVKLAISSLALEYFDLKQYIERIMDELILEASPLDLVDFYSFYGLNIVNFDLSLSDDYMDKAINLAKQILDPSDKVLALSMIVHRYSEIKHNKEIEIIINQLIEEIQDILDNTSRYTRINALLNSAWYLEDIIGFQKYYSNLLEEILSVRNLEKRINIMLKALKVASQLNLTSLGKKILDHLVSIIRYNSKIGEWRKMELASLIVRYTYNFLPDISEQIASTLIWDIRNELKEKRTSRELLISIGKILNNIGIIIPHKLDSIIEYTLEMIQENEKDYIDAFRKSILFLSNIKEAIPKKAKKYLNKTIDLIYNTTTYERVKLIAEQINNIFEINESLANQLLEEILREIEQTDNFKRKIKLYTILIPNIFKHRNELCIQLLEFLEEEIENESIYTKINTYIDLANGFAKTSDECSRKMYRKAIKLIESKTIKSTDKKIGFLKKVLTGIRDKLGDEAWYHQLKKYYETLDTFL